MCLNPSSFDDSFSPSSRYVKVNWDNILPGYERNFHQRPQITDLNYDYGSIMHYPPYAFADRESVPTLVPTLDYPLKFIGQRMHLSNLDQSKINQIYRSVTFWYKVSSFFSRHRITYGQLLMKRCDRHPVPPSLLYPTEEWRADAYMPDAEMKFTGPSHLPLGNMGGHTPYLQEHEHDLILDDSPKNNVQRCHGQGQHYRCPHHKHFFQPWWRAVSSKYTKMDYFLFFRYRTCTRALASVSSRFFCLQSSYYECFVTVNVRNGWKCYVNACITS